MWSHHPLSHNEHKMTCGTKTGRFVCLFVCLFVLLLFLVVAIVVAVVVVCVCMRLLHGGWECGCVHVFQHGP